MSKDGGPAFPHWDGPSGACFNGMSLRDYFAAAVAPAILADVKLETMLDESAKKLAGIALIAYGLADAMIAERKKEAA